MIFPSFQEFFSSFCCLEWTVIQIFLIIIISLPLFTQPTFVLESTYTVTVFKRNHKVYGIYFDLSIPITFAWIVVPKAALGFVDSDGIMYIFLAGLIKKLFGLYC